MEETNMTNHKKIITTIFCLWTLVLIGQNNGSLLQGKVSFITSKNVYVKFDNTAEIAIGDTLYLSGRNDLRPCLVVHHKSKTSCATSIQEGCSTKKDAIIFHKGKEEQNAERILQTDTIKVSSAIATAQADTTKKDKLPSKNQENLSARLMVATYSTLAENNNRHRVAYRLNMNALNIKNSKFSAEAYINYWKNYIPKEKTYEQQTSFLRIYSFAAKYALNKSTTIDIGRKINQKFSSIGAVDGVQIEKYFGKNYAGAIAGFRPDIYNFGFNANLMQYGAYVGRSTISDKLNTETTLGFIEQHNHKPVDRRYAYFQNSMTIHQNLNLFSSAEVDLFNQINGKSFTNFRLTNLYTSLNYRIGKAVNLGFSYDSRKQIIFYETFKTDVEQMLDDDIARQGARARISIRPMKNISLGGSYAIRFQSSNQNQSTNINSFLSISRIPFINGSISFSYNKNNSSYLLSNIYAIQYYRDFGYKLGFESYWRSVNYNYAQGENKSDIQYYGAGFSYKFNKKYSLSFLAELTDQPSDQSIRINTRINRRF